MKTKLFENFTNLYSLNKTLRFELKPIGKTLENMRKKIYTDKDGNQKNDYDEQLQTFLHDQDIENAYQTLKPVLDKLHEDFITQSLESDEAKQINFSEYFDKYKKRDKKQEDDKGEKGLREKIGKLYKIGEKELKKKAGKNNKEKDILKEKGFKCMTEVGILKYIEKDIEAFSSIATKDEILEALYGKDIEKKEGGVYRFFTYFKGFNQNRENYYFTNDKKGKGKQNTAAYRIVDENLPKFCDNAMQFENIVKKKKNKETGKIEEENISRKKEYEDAYKYLKNLGKTTQIKDAESGKVIEALEITDEIFNISYFSKCLSQKEIEEYNRKIGHYNSLINLYNQAKRAEEKDLSKNQKTFKDLPKFKTLFKQIGCGKKKVLFFALTHNTKKEAEKNKENYPKPYSVEQVLEQVKNAGEVFFAKRKKDAEDEEIKTIPDFLDYILKKKNENYEGIYWSKMAFNTISGRYFANWHDLKDKLKNAKIIEKNKSKNDDKEDVKIPEAIELAGFFDVLDKDVRDDWQETFFKENLTGTKDLKDETEKIKREKRKKIISESKVPSEALLKMIFVDMEENMQKFAEKTDNILKIGDYQSDNNKIKIKDWMDCAKYTIQMLKYFSVNETKIKNKDSIVDPIVSNALKDLVFEVKSDAGTEIDWFKWYDALRNYLTKKPQDNAKKNKLKLNFENSTLADGWDMNKESDNACVILRDKDKKIFLAVINKQNKTIFQKEWTEGRGKKKNIRKNPLYETKESEEFLEKMEYDFWSDVSRMIPKCSTQLKAVINHFKDSDENFVFPVGYRVTSGEKFLEECKISKDVFELNNKVYKVKNGEIISAMRYNLTKEQEKTYVKSFQKGYWEILVRHNNPEIKKEELSKRWSDFTTKSGQQMKEDIEYRAKLSTWIDFCKYFLSKYPKTTIFEYNFDETNAYKSVDKFNFDVDISSYKLKINTKISKAIIDKYVKEGKIYLFEIKNQDSNDGKKDGHKKNLHTIYWNALFQEMKNRPKLNGKVEIFYRRSLPEKDLKKKVYKGKEIIENYRFSKEKFIFHCPITLNFCLKNSRINDFVNRKMVKNSEGIYFLGIDRGEKHLAYYSLVDQNGKIIEQGTLNLPFIDQDGNPRSVKAEKRSIGEDGKEKIEIKDCYDYNDLLEARAGDRDYARKNWQTIGTIKELKEGYISQIVRFVADLSVKHSAFIVLEDLNTSFKRGRQKIEKQVYQKFELSLAKKLNFLVDKTAQNGELGSVTNALQLTPPVQNYQDIESKKQVGIMLYTRANYTSQTDPVTGWRKTIYLQRGSEDYIKAQIIGGEYKKKNYEAKFDDIYKEGKDYVFEYTAWFNEEAKKNDNKKMRKKWKLYSSIDGVSLDRFRGRRGDKNEWNSEKYDIVKILNAVFENFDSNKSLLGQIKNENKEPAKFDEFTGWESLRFAIDLIQQIRNTGTDKKDDDFILSPVRDENGRHFDSRENEAIIPNGDANGAYNIARKGIIMNKHIKQWVENGRKKHKEGSDLNLFISDSEWDLWLADKKEWSKALPVFASKEEVEKLRKRKS